MTSKSVTITEPLAPTHPGEVLAEEFMKPLGLSSNALAARIGVPGNRVSMIVAGKRAVSGDTALRLAAAFGTTAEFWMNLQKGYELEVARDGFAAEIERVG
ncbi:MAG: HigA family addiction module antitoxin [Pseudomonadota bacterium]